MVSKAREDLPEPERPVITVNRSRGMSTLMFLRLCWRAPLTLMRSIAIAKINHCSRGIFAYQVGRGLTPMYVDQKLNRSPSSRRRGGWAEVAWPKNGEVSTPVKAPRFE